MIFSGSFFVVAAICGYAIIVVYYVEKTSNSLHFVVQLYVNNMGVLYPFGW